MYIKLTYEEFYEIGDIVTYRGSNMHGKIIGIIPNLKKENKYIVEFKTLPSIVKIDNDYIKSSHIKGNILVLPKKLLNAKLTEKQKELTKKWLEMGIIDDKEVE